MQECKLLTRQKAKALETDASRKDRTGSGWDLGDENALLLTITVVELLSLSNSELLLLTLIPATDTNLSVSS